MAIMINRPGTSAVIHVTANATINTVGTTANSTIASGSEVLTGAAIAQILWGAAGGGYWTIARGTTPLLTLPDTGTMDFAGSGCSLVANSEFAIEAKLVGTGNGHLIIEVQKIPTSTGYTS
jgi:hypothetical protein